MVIKEKKETFTEKFIPVVRAEEIERGRVKNK